jgi:hypothetical protein
MMNPLQTFYNNQSERDAVMAFLIDSLKEVAVEKAFEGASVVGIREANDAIRAAFDKLGEIYGKIDEPTITNSR